MRKAKVWSTRVSGRVTWWITWPSGEVARCWSWQEAVDRLSLQIGLARRRGDSFMLEMPIERTSSSWSTRR